MASFVPPPKPLKAFLFAYHEPHGLLLLLHPPKVSKSGKQKKPAYWQLPGGRVDSSDYPASAPSYSHYLHAGALAACLREAREETGLDLPASRLTSASLLFDPAMHTTKPDSPCIPGGPYVCGEYRRRFFFLVRLVDEDFEKITKPNAACEKVVNVSSSVTPASPSKNTIHPPPLSLSLSHEHEEFCFCKDLLIASTMIKLHSGGVPAEALIMAMRRTDWKKEGRGKLLDRITCSDFDFERVRPNSEANEEDPYNEDESSYLNNASYLNNNGEDVSGGVCDFFSFFCPPENKESVLVLAPPPVVPVKPRGGFKRGSSGGSASGR